jgi:hypothetical protein
LEEEEWNQVIALFSKIVKETQTSEIFEFKSLNPSFEKRFAELVSEKFEV